MPLTKFDRMDRISVALALAKELLSPKDAALIIGASHTYIHDLKNKGLQYIENPLSLIADIRTAANGIPFSKFHLEKTVLSLAMEGNAYSSIREVIRTAFNTHISDGSISAILSRYSKTAETINEQIDKEAFAKIWQTAMDEVFQSGKPVGAGVDLMSGYVMFIENMGDRSAETWKTIVELLGLNGLKLKLSITDAGKGLLKGISLADAGVRIQLDVFHQERDFSNPIYSLERTFDKRLKEIDECMAKIESGHYNSKTTAKQAEAEKTIALEMKLIDELRHIRECLHELLGFTGYGAKVLKDTIIWLAGHTKVIAQKLGDIKDGAGKRIYNQYYKAVKEAERLAARAGNMVQFVCHLEEKIKATSVEAGLAEDGLLLLYRLRTKAEGSYEYEALNRIISRKLGRKRAMAEQIMKLLISTTKRASSLIESTNSRIRKYMDVKRYVPSMFFPLLRLYMNTMPFERSRISEKKGKSAAEYLLGKPYSFYSLLGLLEV